MNYQQFVFAYQDENEDPEYLDIIRHEYPRFYDRYYFEKGIKDRKQQNNLNTYKKGFKNRQIMKRNNNQGYGNNQNSNNNQKATVKHSGAKSTTYFPKTGPNSGVEQHLTTGWRLSKGELIAIKCVTTEKSKLSDKGWFGSIACTMTNTKTGVVAFHWGTMEKKSGKVVIDTMAFVINPKAKNGGYAGTFLRS